eukprot:TRINITY_DN14105_c0_g1_i1.p1 TRINITY_DN14105_c0_g1~~TRINITY_DN14105_c0_g1_i1.p1  ORF type:complete len:619 (-),score=194.66 TRINITY_DN14105_c0_g1_i1:140-1996(-)
MFSVPSAIANAVNAAASYVYSNETFQDITQLMKEGTVDLSHLLTEEELEFFTEAEPLVLHQATVQKQNYLTYAAGVVGKFGRSLSSSFVYLTTHNLDFAVSATDCDLTPHMQLWLVNLKDPSCGHMKVRLDAFVTEFMKQQLPLPPSSTQQSDGAVVSVPQFSSLLHALEETRGEEGKDTDRVEKEEAKETKEEGAKEVEVTEKEHEENATNKEEEEIKAQETGDSEENGERKSVSEGKEAKDDEQKNEAVEDEEKKSDEDKEKKGDEDEEKEKEKDGEDKQRGGSVKSDLQSPEVLEYEEQLIAYQEEAGKQIQTFIEEMVRLFKKHPFWLSTTNTREKEDILWECIERYIVTQVYRRVNVANKLRDWKFYQLASSFSFILPKHLDIKESLSPELIAECGGMLTNMNFYKTVRGKLICIANCCITIFNYLNQTAGKSATADEFITVLTYIIIKTNPPSLVSNLSFINDVRHPKMLMSSWGYMASNLGVAIQFIFQLEPRLLSLGDDFDLEDDWQLCNSVLNKSTVQDTEGEQQQEISLNNEEQSLSLSSTSDSSVSVFGEEGQDFPVRYKFWNCCPDDLSPADIPELLAEYKRLALLEYNLRTERQKAKKAVPEKAK